jgi:hypothetical protein
MLAKEEYEALRDEVVSGQKVYWTAFPSQVVLQFLSGTPGQFKILRLVFSKIDLSDEELDALCKDESKVEALADVVNALFMDAMPEAFGAIDPKAESPPEAPKS